MRKDPFKIYTEQDDIKDREIEPYYKESNIDDLFSGNIQNESLKIALSKKQLFWILIIIFCGFVLIFGKIFYVQVAKGGYYRELAEGNRIRLLGITATRGVITDRNGVLLTRNVPNFYLAVVPSDLPKDANELNQIASDLALDLSMDFNEVKNFFDNLSKFSYQPRVLKEFIDPNLAIKLKVKVSSLPGISIEMTAIRDYPLNNLFSHVLGYTGKMTEEEFNQNKNNYLFTDYIGKTGLELQYENELKGKNGKKEIEVDSYGNEKRVIASEEPIIGNNLITTLDFKLQEVLSNELDKAVNSSGGKGGAAIAIDPRNGEILAIISYATFDPNKFVRGISTEDYQNLIDDPATPLFFKTISGEYPSGSTIKPVIASAALQEGIITPSTTINSVGGIQIDKWFFPDWKSGGHGVTNVIKALSESVNTFFYMVGGGTEDFKGLGIDRIVKYAELFGLSQKSGIDLPSEATGFLPSQDWKEKVKKEPWYIGDTYHLAIGQGDLLVTPLQIADTTATVANGGTFYKPHLLKGFTNSKNEVVYEREKEMIRQDFVDKDKINIIKQGMREAVLSGSSAGLAVLPVTAAGKTGTAQFAEGNHAWFTCFAPYENPEIVITVLVEKGGEGNVTALPVAKNTLNWYFSQ